MQSTSCAERGAERSAYGEAPAGLSELSPVRVAQLRNTGFLRLDLRVSGGPIRVATVRLDPV